MNELTPNSVERFSLMAVWQSEKIVAGISQNEFGQYVKFDDFSAIYKHFNSLKERPITIDFLKSIGCADHSGLVEYSDGTSGCSDYSSVPDGNLKFILTINGKEYTFSGEIDGTQGGWDLTYGNFSHHHVKTIQDLIDIVLGNYANFLTKDYLS